MMQGRILVAGGGANTTPNTSDDHHRHSTNAAYTVNLNGTTPVVTQDHAMQYARQFANAVVLPNGEVMVIGGNTSGLKFSDTGAVLTPEIWNPTTGAWRTVANMAIPRAYHSLALLLPNGTVWSGGGGLSGGAGDHRDAQVFTPPSLYTSTGSLAVRPVITDGPAKIGPGNQFTVRATAGLTKFAFIRMASQTHSVNTDLRYLSLPFTETSAGVYTLTGNANSNVMVPGYWMLFGLNSSRRPLGGESHPGLPEPGRHPAKSRQPAIRHRRPHPAPHFGLRVARDHSELLRHRTSRRTHRSILTPASFPEGHRRRRRLLDHRQRHSQRGHARCGLLQLERATPQSRKRKNSSASGGLTSPATCSPTSRTTPAIRRIPTTVIFSPPLKPPRLGRTIYGQRVRGYLHPTVTGTYRFWIAGDDQSRLLLSTDANPANAVDIAERSRQHATHAIGRNFPEQASAPITLEAGKRYYIEALMKEEKGRQSRRRMACGRETPAIKVIPGQYLSAFDPVPTPLAAWHLDEGTWNGTAGEVKELIGKVPGIDGTAIGGATTSSTIPPSREIRAPAAPVCSMAAANMSASRSTPRSTPEISLFPPGSTLSPRPPPPCGRRGFPPDRRQRDPRLWPLCLGRWEMELLHRLHLDRTRRTQSHRQPVDARHGHLPHHLHHQWRANRHPADFRQRHPGRRGRCQLCPCHQRDHF